MHIYVYEHTKDGALIPFCITLPLYYTLIYLTTTSINCSIFLRTLKYLCSLQPSVYAMQSRV